MSSQRRPGAPRGPLPAGVYWRRRVFVLGVAFALVFVLARWLGGSSDGSDDDAPAAEQAGSQVQATDTVTAGATDATATETAGKPGKKGKPTLAVPEGACDSSDIAITPSVAKGAEAGRDVKLRLSLQTNTSEACTWQVSRSTVVVRISQGGQQVWSTQQCPGAVPAESVVVRRAVATVVELTWEEARESRAHCMRRTDWAMPGDYTISAAPMGGEPAEAAFTLGKTTRETKTVSPDATTEKTQKKAQRKSGKKPTTPTN